MKMRTLKLFANSILAVVAILTTSASFAQDRQVAGVGITVFANENFHGKTATFRQDIPDLTRSGFNDVISSLKVPPGETWEICEHINYQGRCLVVLVCLHACLFRLNLPLRIFKFVSRNDAGCR